MLRTRSNEMKNSDRKSIVISVRSEYLETIDNAARDAGATRSDYMVVATLIQAKSATPTTRRELSETIREYWEGRL